MNTLLNWVKVNNYEPDCSLETIFVEHFPPIKSIKERFNFGTFEWRIPSLGIRYLRQSTAIHIHNDWFEPPTRITKWYLDTKFPKRLRACSTQRDTIKQHITPPLFIKPGVYRDHTYVDLKAAYYNIVSRWGWDVDYYPGKWLIPGRNVSDFPLPDHKVARNCLVSFVLPSNVSIWTGEYFIRQATYNLHLNLCLWRLVQDVLHDIAAIAEIHGAKYIHTDGYILPTSNVPDFTSYLDQKGIKWGIKAAGNSVIFAFGNWFVGEKATKHFTCHIGKNHRYIMNVDEKSVNVIYNAKKTRLSNT